MLLPITDEEALRLLSEYLSSLPLTGDRLTDHYITCARRRLSRLLRK